MTLTAVATLALTPIAVVGAGAAYDLIEENGNGPIDPIVQTKSLADSASVLVEDAAIATQGLIDDAHPNRGVVKEITSDTEFSQFALTWTGSADIASFVRAQRADGTWSEWFDAEPEYPADGNSTGINGTELIYVEPTKRVQVSTLGLNIFGPGSGVDLADIEGADKLDLSEINLDELGEDAAQGASDAADAAKDAVTDAANAAKDAAEKAADAAGAAASEPAESAESTGANAEPAAASESAEPAKDSKTPVKWTDIEPVADELPLDQVDAVLIDGQAAETAVDPIVDAKNVTGMPKVITRAGWGANENNRCSSPDYDDKLVGATVHHTAGSNNYTESQSAGIVRGIYQYHAQTLGWCDVGYNALVDKYGNIFEGRYGGLDKNVQGAHAGGFNTGTFGISMMGDYSTVAPSEAALTSVGNMIGWRLKVAGVKPDGQITMTSGGTSYSKYPYGTPVTLPTIFAHRDVGNTTCPGDSGYAQMGKIRSIAEKKYEALNDGKVDNETPGGLTDLIVPQDSQNGSSSQTSTTPSTTTSTTASGSTGSASTSKPSTSSSTSSTSSSASATPSRTTGTTGSSTSSSTTSATTSKNHDGLTTKTTSGNASSSTTKSSESSSSTSTMTTEPSEPTDSVDSPDSPSLPQPIDEQKAAAVEAISGARSMLASALGMLGAPGLGQTADAILASVGRSVENGPSIAELPIVAGQIIKIDQQNDLAAEWRHVSEELGSVLGYAMSGIQSGSTVSNATGQADALLYVKFSNGVITSSETTGANALWGKIADEWARQGFEVGKLGAPTKTQVIEGNFERAVFQHGTITLDRSTGKVTTELN